MTYVQSEDSGQPESPLCALWVANDPYIFMWAAKTDQTGWMPRLIRVFAGHTRHFVGFVMLWLISQIYPPVKVLKRYLHGVQGNDKTLPVLHLKIYI